MKRIINQPVLVLLLVLTILGFGYYQFTNLPKDAFPDISPVMVPIFAEGHGMAPEEMERLITYPVENAMNGLPGVSLVKSTSAFGMSVIYVYFTDDTDIYFARQLVSQRLGSAVQDLPEMIDTPVLGPISSGLGEVFMYYLEIDEGKADTGGKDPRTYLREINDWQVKYQLQTVPGVTEVLSMGGFVLQYQIQLNPLKMLSYGIGLEDIVEAVNSNNMNVGGQFLVVGSEEYLVRGVGLLENLDEIRSIPLKVINGIPVTIAEVADVNYGSEMRRGVVTLNGNGEVVSGIVIKLIGENSLTVINSIREKLPQISNSLPEGVTLVPYYDQSELVSRATGTVITALLQGGFLVVVILFLFLWNLRTAMIVALSLPISSMIAVLIMGWQGLSANLMSFGGIAIAIGMLGDGSIVVAENIYRKFQKINTSDVETRSATVLAGLSEVWKPILFSISIIIMVFLPILSLEGVEGKLFRPLALTVVFGLIGSIVSALLVTPVLANLMIRPRNVSEPAYLTWLKDKYSRFLSAVIAKKYLILVPAALLLTAAAVIIPRLGTEFVPTLEEGNIQILVTGAPSASLENMSELIIRMEKEIMSYQEVDQVITKIGRPEAGSHPHPVNFASMQISLKDRNSWRFRNKSELIESFNDRLSEFPGIQLNFTQPIQNLFDELLSGVKTQLAVKVYGDDLNIIRETAQEISGKIESIDGLADLGVEQNFGQPQFKVVPDRELAMRYGVSVDAIMEAVELAVGGEVLSQIYQNTRRFAIHIRFQDAFRSTVDDIGGILIPRMDGGIVPLREVARVETVIGPVQINREDNQRRWTINANIRGRDLGAVVNDIRKVIAAEINLPEGVTVDIGGQFENQERAMKRLSLVIPIVLLLIMLFLYLALGSFKQALLIYFSIPLALIGGILGLYLSGEYLSVPAAVGFIAVFGIAIQNGLVLVDTISRIESTGKSAVQAAIDGAVTRLRPVLMTAMTTIFGLIPLILSSGAGSEVQRPLAVVVVWGLLTSTILTVGILPTLYPIFANGKKEIKR